MGAIQPFLYSGLGLVTPFVSARARRFIFRATDEGLKVTVPQAFRMEDLMEALAAMYEKLRLLEERHRKSLGSTMPAFGWDFRIETETTAVSIRQGRLGAIYIHEKPPVIAEDGKISVPGEIIVLCPPNINFASDGVEKALSKGIENVLIRQARNYLIRKIQRKASLLGISISSAKVSRAHHRWGSCSSGKCISLSLYVYLLPDELQDLVIVHELMHTHEMNHSCRFHALVNKNLGGKEKELMGKLKGYHLSLRSFAKSDKD